MRDCFTVCTRGDSVSLLALLRKDPRILDHRSRFDQGSLLHRAASNGHVQLFDILLHPLSYLPEDTSDKQPGFTLPENYKVKGIPIDVQNKDGDTPLHVAARNGKLESVKALLSMGASVNVLNSDGENAIHQAAWEGHNEIIDLLMTKRCDHDVPNKFGNTAVKIAAWREHQECVRSLSKLRQGS